MNEKTVMSETRVILMDLPPSVRGFTCLGEDYSPVIILNARLSLEQQRKTYRHELRHIVRGDLYDDDYREYGGSA